ncbi:hypothetical protein [Mycobacterium avium]|uniref:hypothetical protein n=1 Tax=Mycobacterium avium TaxID=1764 RepID=UPI0003D1EE18|nr:hypothetical protein [Mycobacterium avium]ETB28637.1 hypothetical protein O971_14265 [Mycobacterium avium subsp. hominissuis 10-4249]KDO95324.1 hypothetical protein MAVA5_13420 [Mycobacterium avium subsp. hominissuis A5]
MAVVAGFPDLSQVLAWPTQHLTDAARHWEAVGERSYSVIHQVWRDGLSSDWRGRAADALHAATHDDVGKTSGVADQLRAAAGVARSGACELVAARSRVRYAVEDAMRSGFDVYEDMSVADRSTGGSAAQRAARQAQAQAVAGDIRRRAAELVALDQQVAGRVTAATAGIRDTFPQTPDSDAPQRKPKFQAVDHHTFKEDPPPNGSYPVNEVVAEATDLDGNHVVLRRGYYDAEKREGWGWDKAYWRHGVVNPNVFKDLISHSRPEHQPDGTLRYDVLINRVHCASGPLGIASCQDTGESLTMRIVVDPRVGRADVPGGEQKGVITMFPLEGGSGVIQLGPKWTWTPPWVNNNVPIN